MKLVPPFPPPPPMVTVGEPEIDAFIRAERPDHEPPLPTLVLRSDEISLETISRSPFPVRIQLTLAEAERLKRIVSGEGKG